VYTVEDIITSAKRRADMPTATGFITQAEMVSICDEELQTYVVPLITSQREDYFVAHYDVALTANVIAYRLPTRAVGQALLDVWRISPTSELLPFPRLSRGDLANAPRGFYLDGNVLMLGIENPALVGELGPALRMSYYQRPNTLVATSAVAVAQVVNPGTKTITTAGAVPGTFSGASTFDIIRGRPGFENLGVDLTASAGGSSVVFSAALPGDTAVGDVIAIAGQSNIPQIPDALHPLLAQRVALKLLESKGDNENAKTCADVLRRMEADAVKLISPRVANKAEVIVNRGGLFRNWW
jgi:hypothetical protein